MLKRKRKLVSTKANATQRSKNKSNDQHLMPAKTTLLVFVGAPRASLDRLQVEQKLVGSNVIKASEDFSNR